MTGPIPSPSDLPSGAPAPQTGPGQEGGRVHRPWGWYETLLIARAEARPDMAGYGVKRLWIHAEQRISLQRHHQRSEHWVVVAGSGLLECGELRIEASAGSTLEVPVGAIHRATAGSDGLMIIEVQRGPVLREDDIERLADDYGRVIGSADNL